MSTDTNIEYLGKLTRIPILPTEARREAAYERFKRDIGYVDPEEQRQMEALEAACNSEE